MSRGKLGQFYVSTGCLNNRSLEIFLEECANNNIWNIELSSGIPYKSQMVQVLKKTRHKFNFLVHNYFPPPAETFVLNLAASNERSLNKSLEFCMKTVNLCAELGVPFYSVHAGFRATIEPDSLGKFLKYDNIVPYNQAFITFVESIKLLSTYARSQGIQLLVEPNVVTEFNLVNGRNDLMLICDVDEVIHLANSVDAPGFGILLDTGHLNITSKVLGFSHKVFVEKIAQYIRAFHLHDNDGSSDTHQPVKPGTWVFDILNKPEFVSLPIIIESKFKTIDDLSQHVAWLKKEIGRE